MKQEYLCLSDTNDFVCGIGTSLQEAYNKLNNYDGADIDSVSFYTITRVPVTITHKTIITEKKS